MEKEIMLIKDHGVEGLSDLELIDKFYQFMQAKGLNKTLAFSIIHFLQEQVAVFPDNFAKCISCGTIYDTHCKGRYSELSLQFYCSESCEPRGLLEREQKRERKKHRTK